MRPSIAIRDTAGSITYYTYDTWTDSGTTTKLIGCSISLSQNHQGSFTLQIEDETDAISSNVDLGNMVVIDVGKQSTQRTQFMIGLIRQKGYSRGADKKRLLTVSGSSVAIRLNEKILYYVNEAAKLPQDNLTIDINDITRKADLLLQNGLASLSSEGLVLAGGVATSSDVENFIASLAIEFGEAQDLCDTLEEQTNGEIFCDTSAILQFRHLFQPPVPGKGFTIKNKYAATDNADDTMYLRGKSWNYTSSAFKSDGYSNRIYGILPADQVPSTRDDAGFRLSNGNPATTATLPTLETAAKFRPTHSHFLPGDIFVVGGESASSGSTTPWITRFRICYDSGGVPLNVGGVIVNIDFQPAQFQSPIPLSGTDESLVLMNDQVFYNSANARIDSFNLDTTRDYWLIASNDNIAASHQFNWAGVLKTGAITMFTSTTFSTNSAGGAGWALGGGGANVLMNYAMPRVRAEAFEASDPKAVQFMGSGLVTTGGTFIESTLSSIPSTIKTREAMYRYMANQLYYMARPRINWNMATVTAPNVPIFPGDPILISDSVMGFSASGGQAMMATCGDMTYSWNANSYEAPTILSIQPVSNPTSYL